MSEARERTFAACRPRGSSAADPPVPFLATRGFGARPDAWTGSLRVEVQAAEELESGATVKTETTWTSEQLGPVELGALEGPTGDRTPAARGVGASTPGSLLYAPGSRRRVLGRARSSSSLLPGSARLAEDLCRRAEPCQAFKAPLTHGSPGTA